MKRPWNIIDLPVYSLLSNDINGNINMNICTYVSAVSMKPKIYSIAIDFKTKTYDNLIASDRVVLQLLSKKNISLLGTDNLIVVETADTVLVANNKNIKDAIRFISILEK